ncbi:hypothetical protein G3N57_06405 [Paraburkholderia sp. Se-20369]|nr:hypothetical protein [Paraburkholderia sp. Se-20369]
MFERFACPGYDVEIEATERDPRAAGRRSHHGRIGNRISMRRSAAL